MKHLPERLRYLMERHLERQTSAEEEQELMRLVESHWDSKPLTGVFDEVDWDAMKAGILAEAPVRRMWPVRTVRRIFWRWVGVAAAVVIVVVGSWWWTRGRRSLETVPVASHEALPGGNRAVLTLSGGQQILLDSAAMGELAQQGASRVTKTGNGALVYRADQAATGGTSGGTTGTAILYNTLSTPRGGQYQLTLPDGTKVWLNAASSITYPTAFAGAERKVEITGEAYLDVAKDAAKPFSVIAAGSTVQVLGTSFNINAYKDEPASRITLIDGRILVAGVSLQPGQQAIREPGSPVRVEKAADLSVVMAWKNGSFRFQRTDLRTAMRQLARWYDVDVVYQGAIPSIEFGGSMKRDLNLSEVLHILERSGVHFTIDGKQLLVHP